MNEMNIKLDKYEEEIQNQISMFYKKLETKQNELKEAVENANMLTSRNLEIATQVLTEIKILNAKIEVLEDTLDNFGRMFKREEE